MNRIKAFLLSALAGMLALAGAVAIAQVTIPAPPSMGVNDRVQVIPGGSPTAGNVYATLAQMKAWVLGGQSGHTGTPVLSSCGTSPAIATGSTDTAGTFTIGTGAGSVGCTVTFAQAFTTAPSCVVTSQTAYATTTPAYTISTTAITLTTADVDSTIWNYVCIAKAGG